jgi:hypothetical protein
MTTAIFCSGCKTYLEDQTYIENGKEFAFCKKCKSDIEITSMSINFPKKELK